MFTLRTGATARCRVAVPRMSMWMESICVATGGAFENVAILVAIAVHGEGYREVLGAAAGMKEDKPSWVSFLSVAARGRGLDGVSWWLGTSASNTYLPINKIDRYSLNEYSRNIFCKKPDKKH